jgi:hypothetical protein
MERTEEPRDLTASERFPHGLRQTWELELLISGAVVFALLQLPSAVDPVYHRLEVHLAGTGRQALFLGYYFLKLILYMLSVSFLIHLAARAYWVGLVGLDAVFPNGIRWERLRYGPISERVYRERLPALPSLIEKVDDFCSAIFSCAFMFVLVFALAFPVTALLGGAAFLISLGLDGVSLGAAFRALLFLFIALPLAASLLDRSMGRKLDPESLPARSIRAFQISYYWMYLLPLYGTSMMVLFSNVRKRALYPVLFLLFFGILGLFLFNDMGLKDELAVFAGYEYLPEKPGAREVKPVYYEDQRPEGEVFPRTPSIQSDVIRDPYVRVFIPYSPRWHDPVIARRCPEVKPARDGGPPGPVLRCLARIYGVRLDGRPLPDLELHFATHPETGVRGVVGYIPTAGLARGSHLLRVEAVRHPKRKNPPPPEPYLIRFWL